MRGGGLRSVSRVYFDIIKLDALVIMKMYTLLLATASWPADAIDGRSLSGAREIEREQ